MAKYRRGRKIEPAVQNLWFSLPSWDGVNTTTSSHYVDLSQVTSLVNRRFMRQGVQWVVSNISIHFPELDAGEVISTRPSITISKLPTTWPMANSWTKSFKAWQKMNREALAENESASPKFLDFKIYADATHHAKGIGANLMPLSDQAAFTPGEWFASKVVVPFGPASPGNTVEFEMVAVGANFPGAGASGLNAVSLIEGYAASRALPGVVDPNTPGDMDDADGSTPENWITAMFNDGTDQDSEVLANLTTEGDRPPYPYEGDSVSVDTQYPNGANQGSGLEIHDYKAFTATTLSNTLTFDGGVFPCGLVKIFNQIRYEDGAGNTIQKPAILKIQLVPGNHRGYLCEPMMEM